jgi:hypothetical protein
MSPVRHYCINGQEPPLLGLQCTGFVLQHFYEGLQITDQVNVAHLRFEDQWYRLYFECGTVFWRVGEKPEASQNTDLAFGLLLNDLSGVHGIVGQLVEAVSYEGTEAGDVQASIHLSGGRVLKFAYSCEADATRLVAQPIVRADVFGLAAKRSGRSCAARPAQSRRSTQPLGQSPENRAHVLPRNGRRV